MSSAPIVADENIYMGSVDIADVVEFILSLVPPKLVSEAARSLSVLLCA